MSFILKVIDRWAALENDDLDRLLKKYYGPMFQLGMVFPSWKRSALPLTVPLVLLHSIFITGNLIVVGYTAYVAFLYENDLDLASLAGHYFLLLLWGFLNMISLNVNRELNSQNHTRIAFDVGKYSSGRIYSDKKCIYMEKQIHRQSKKYMLLPLFIVLIVSSVMFVPYVSKWLRGTGTLYSPCKVNMFLPLAAWYPFPTHEGIAHYMVVASQMLGASSLALITIASLLNFLQYSQRVKLEFKVLSYSLETLFARSKKIYLQMNPDKISTFEINDPGYQRVIGFCLRDSIVHHQTLVEMMDAYHGLISMPVALGLITGAGGIGLGLLSILRALQTGDVESFIVFTLLLLGEVICIFMISLIGESLTEETVVLRHKLYNVKWYNMDIPNRRTLLIFQIFITEPLILTAGRGLVDLTMETFSSIMNSAYSFFNLVNVQKN